MTPPGKFGGEVAAGAVGTGAGVVEVDGVDGVEAGAADAMVDCYAEREWVRLRICKLCTVNQVCTRLGLEYGKGIR